MRELMIVDGYNLMHYDPRYKRLKDVDLEMTRIKLVEDLAAMATLSDRDIVVVFDAAASAGKERQKAFILGIEVWFTRGGESADEVIERLSYDASAERRVVVATSDYAQQKVVFRPGVTVKSSRQLSEEMKELIDEARRYYAESTRSRRRPRVEDRIDGAVKRALDKLIREP